MTNCDRQGWIFLSHPHTNNGFFFMLTTMHRILYEKRLPKYPEFAEMRHGDYILTLQWPHGSTWGQRAVDLWLFDYDLSHRFVQVCEINQIHQWCSVRTGKSQLECSPFQWETRPAEWNTRRWIRGLGYSCFHVTPLMFFLTIPFWRCTVKSLLIMSQLMFTKARAIKNVTK